MDKAAFSDAIVSLRDEMAQKIDVDDYRALRRIININTLFLVLGTATAWFYINPFSMIFLSLWLTGRWRM